VASAGVSQDSQAVESPVAALVRRGSHDGEICFVRLTPRPPFDRRLLFAGGDTDAAGAFRKLRQQLLARDGARTILCTSACQGDGKTTAAANLALAFTELGAHRVLLLEVAPRTGSLGEVFGFNPPRGLKHQIMRHRLHPSGPWVVVQLGPPPLYVMAVERHSCPRCGLVAAAHADACRRCGGGLADDEFPVMDCLGFASALERFQQAFDYLIVDAPALFSGGEVNLIQHMADAVVLSARKSRSDDRALHTAVKQIPPALLASVVLLD